MIFLIAITFLDAFTPKHRRKNDQYENEINDLHDAMNMKPSNQSFSMNVKYKRDRNLEQKITFS